MILILDTNVSYDCQFFLSEIDESQAHGTTFSSTPSWMAWRTLLFIEWIY
jgi:hypothetical protein